MEDNLFNFESLKVYQKSLDYADFAYVIAGKLPELERYNLTDQLRRAATSIALNLAEGSGGTKKEFKNFIRISKRSIKECIVCTTLAHRRKYISDEENQTGRQLLTEISKMASGLYKSLGA